MGRVGAYFKMVTHMLESGLMVKVQVKVVISTKTGVDTRAKFGIVSLMVLVR